MLDKPLNELQFSKGSLRHAASIEVSRGHQKRSFLYRGYVFWPIPSHKKAGGVGLALLCFSSKKKIDVLGDQSNPFF